MKSRHLVWPVRAWLVFGLLNFCWFTGAPEPSQALEMSIAFVVDASGSMSGDKLKAGKDAVRNSIKSITAQKSLRDQKVEICLFAFSGCGNCRLQSPLTQDDNKILTSLGFSAAGSTPLTYSMTEASKYLRQNGIGRKGKIIMLTDGGETCGGNPVEAAASIKERRESVEMFPKNWHFDNHPNKENALEGLKETVVFMRRRAKQLLASNPNDTRARLIQKYADEIWNWQIYYEPNPWMSSADASTNPLTGNLTVYPRLLSYRAFYSLSPRPDKYLAEVASTLMHERHHKNGFGEFDTHVMLMGIFDSLGVPAGSAVRVNIEGNLTRRMGSHRQPDGSWSRPWWLNERFYWLY